MLVPDLALRAGLVGCYELTRAQNACLSREACKSSTALTMTALNNTLNSHDPTHHSRKHNKCKSCVFNSYWNSFALIVCPGAQRDNSDWSFGYVPYQM